MFVYKHFLFTIQQSLTIFAPSTLLNRIEADSTLRAAWLGRDPKAAVYARLPDFRSIAMPQPAIPAAAAMIQRIQCQSPPAHDADADMRNAEPASRISETIVRCFFVRMNPQQQSRSIPESIRRNQRVPMPRKPSRMNAVSKQIIQICAAIRMLTGFEGCLCAPMIQKSVRRRRRQRDRHIEEIGDPHRDRKTGAGKCRD